MKMIIIIIIIRTIIFNISLSLLHLSWCFVENIPIKNSRRKKDYNNGLGLGFIGDSVIHSSHHIEATVNFRSGIKEKSADLFCNRLACCFPMKTGNCVQTTNAAT